MYCRKGQMSILTFLKKKKSFWGKKKCLKLFSQKNKYVWNLIRFKPYWKGSEAAPDVADFARCLSLTEHTPPLLHTLNTLAVWLRSFLSPSPSLQSFARQWKHWEAVSMVRPGLLFDWKHMYSVCSNYGFIRSLSNTPGLSDCTSGLLFAHGGRQIS